MNKFCSIAFISTLNAKTYFYGVTKVLYNLLSYFTKHDWYHQLQIHSKKKDGLKGLMIREFNEAFSQSSSHPGWKHYLYIG